MPALAPVLSFQNPIKPREKLLAKGASSLSDTELIAAMLGTGTRQLPVMMLAHRIAAFVESREHINANDLLSIPGVGQAKAVLLAASVEFARRRLFKARRVIKSTEDLTHELMPYASRRQEHFLCVALNGAQELLATRLVYIGSANRVMVTPRDVFAEPISENAAYVILAHNHPSGNPEPSSCDIQLTRKLRIAGHLMGVEVLDHLILTHHTIHQMSKDAIWADMVSF